MDGCRGAVRNARSISVSRGFVMGVSDSDGAAWRRHQSINTPLIRLGTIRPAAPTQAVAWRDQKDRPGRFRRRGPREWFAPGGVYTYGWKRGPSTRAGGAHDQTSDQFG